MKPLHELKPGDRAILTDPNCKPREVVVEKVGRVWVTVECGRKYSVDSGRAGDGYSSRLWKPEDWDDYNRREVATQRIRLAVGYGNPVTISTADLERAARLLTGQDEGQGGGE